MLMYSVQGHQLLTHARGFVLLFKRVCVFVCVFARLCLTLTVRWCLRDGVQRMLLVLQQPVQRFTSTHGGHMMKLADVGSTWLLGIS